jgi:small subunit ribosomal protein S5
MSRNVQKKVEQDLIEKLVHVNRVTKVVKGGRNMSFAALMIVGDGKGRVGFGTGKAKEVSDAVKKAVFEAKNSMIKVSLRSERTIHHDVTGNFGAGSVLLRSAPPGTGIIAGGPTRAVLEALGVHDVVAKSTGSSNSHNMVRATFDALSLLSSPKSIAERRGKKVNEILPKRSKEGE